jgi:vitamin B12/bleomycin/antimicrobial peptide transport system ATP-binding/permease protein
MSQPRGRRGFEAVIWPYWRSSQRRGAWVLLAMLLLLSALNSGILVLFSILLGELTTPLSRQDWAGFSQVLGVSLGFAILAIPLAALKPFVQSKLSWYWWRWLNRDLLDRYLKHRSYYHLEFQPELDNPDQRLAEDARNVTQQAVTLGVAVADSGLQLLAFAGLLFTTSPLLMGLLLLYALVGNGLVLGGFGRGLLRLNLQQLQRETAFRFGLARSRDHGESIAFYGGEAQESALLMGRFSHLYQNYNRLLTWQFWLDLFQALYQGVPFFLPAIVLGPQILAGTLPVGAFVQSGIAFKSVLNALAVIVNQFEQVSTLNAGMQRVSELVREIDQVSETGHLQVRELGQSPLRVRNLSLSRGDRTLFTNLNLDLAAGESLLIVGRSGLGKTTLLRAIAGLWTTGSGEIERPPLEQILFLPQRPYWIEGSLQEQLCYPLGLEAIAQKDWIDSSPVALHRILDQVGLKALGDQGLETVCDWGQVLSGGEQQRLSLGRLLVQRPRYAVLDESTSALDEANETRIYELLHQSGIAYISVGHRSSLRQFHDRVLDLTEFAAL